MESRGRFLVLWWLVSCFMVVGVLELMELKPWKGDAEELGNWQLYKIWGNDFNCGIFIVF